MKPCIAVAEYHIPHQTFVNRHIDLLFSAETVVIAGRLNNLRETPPHRFFKRRNRQKTVADVMHAPFAQIYNFARHGSYRVPFGSARSDLVAFLTKQRPDFILSEFGTHAITLAPLANELTIPIFTYFRGFDATSEVRNWRGRRAYRKLMPRLDGVFSVSQFLLDHLAARGIQHPNSHVIPSGVNVSALRPAEKITGKCLAVGRFVEKKAPHITLRAFANAAQNAPAAHLTMIGDGPMLEKCRLMAKELGVVDKVRFAGALPHEDVFKELADTQVFLQHSVTARNENTEGLPTAIQEALAAGCAVVSTRHAGIPEAVSDGETGWLVEEWDEDGFTDCIHKALSLCEAERAAMAARCRAVAEERFDNTKLLRLLEARITESLIRHTA
jgi:glycosyltransferase involved in cell wall biosynthesis